MTRFLLVALLAINAITFLVFGFDKWCAGRGRRRVPEAHLLGLCAAAGALGGGLGMLAFRHKTRKRSFQLKFWAVAVLNAAFVVGAYRLGR